MNANSKKAAVKKYSADEFKGSSKEQIIELLNADDKNYSSEDVVEIVEALFPEGDQQGEPSKHWQRWEVKITQSEAGPKYEKLKMAKEVVKISDEEAEALNKGVLQGSNTHAVMYFKPE